jgi:putative PEP-CTERM system TPR-repeat lipoprotein
MTHDPKSMVATPTSRLLIAVLIATGTLLGGCDAFVSADRRVERAEEHFAKGQFRPAMADLKTALEREPSHVPARIALARLSLWLGDVESAEKEISKAEEAGADPAIVRSFRYELLAEQGKFDELSALVDEDTSLPAERRALLEIRIALAKGDVEAARSSLARGLTAAPTDAALLVEKARLDMADGDLDAVLTLPEQVRESKESYARALMMRGAAQMNRGEFAAARQTFAEAQTAGSTLRLPEQMSIAVARTEADLSANDVVAAERSLARVANWAPQAYVTHYLRARIAMAKNDFTTAAAEAQRSLRVAPDHIQSQLLLASANLAQGSHEQATDVLTRLLSKRPNAIAARKLLAQVYLARNQPQEAQRVLTSNASDADSDMDWLMGAALLRAGDVSAGVEHLERSVAAMPNDIARRLDLAGAYIEARTPEKAIPLLDAIPAESVLAPRAKAMLVLASAVGKSAAEARKEVERLAAGNADDAMLLTVIGRYLTGIRDLPAARKYLEQAIGLEPRRTDARMVLARIDASERKMDEARVQLDEVIRIEPRHQQARLALAELAWTAGDKAGARKHLEDAITADPGAIDARLRLAQMAFIEGDGARARGLLDQTLQAAMDRKRALTATGQVLARAGLSDEALARFKEASAAGDDAASLHAARLYLDLGDVGKARESAQGTLRSATHAREAEQLLVLIDARDGQVTRAFERAKRLANTTNPAALDVLKGDLHAVAGQSDAAVTAYEAAQRQQPTAQVAVKIFNVQRAAGSNAPERSLKEWLARSPKDAAVRRMLALYYDSTGNAAGARAEYETLLADGSADPLMLNNLAWSMHEQGDPRAVELAKRAYEGAPQHPEIADTYGWILVRMDRITEGLPMLKSAFAGAPANPEIQFHLAYAYAKSGQGGEAERLLKQAIASGQPFPSRSQAEELLQSLAKPRA